MIDTQLRFKRAASVKPVPGSEPSHIHIVRPSQLRHREVADVLAETLPDINPAPASEQVEEAA